MSLVTSCRHTLNRIAKPKLICLATQNHGCVIPTFSLRTITPCIRCISCILRGIVRGLHLDTCDELPVTCDLQTCALLPATLNLQPASCIYFCLVRLKFQSGPLNRIGNPALTYDYPILNEVTNELRTRAATKLESCTRYKNGDSKARLKPEAFHSRHFVRLTKP
jgi:hypothetical protein